MKTLTRFSNKNKYVFSRVNNEMLAALAVVGKPHRIGAAAA